MDYNTKRAMDLYKQEKELNTNILQHYHMTSKYFFQDISYSKFTFRTFTYEVIKALKTFSDFKFHESITLLLYVTQPKVHKSLLSMMKRIRIKGKAFQLLQL